MYACDTCKIHTEITKPLSQLDQKEVCSCGQVMHRTISWAGQMKPGDISFKPDYYTAFGKVLTNPSQLKDELKREKYEKGIELIEVGNERPNYTPKRKEYDWDGAGKALYQELRKRRG